MTRLFKCRFGFVFSFAFIVFSLVLSPRMAMAVPIIPPLAPGHMFVEDGTVPVSVTFISAHSVPFFISFDTVGLVTSPPSVPFFDSSPGSGSGIGTIFPLGLFPAGTELEFVLTRISDGVEFFSGGTPNPDLEIHASLDFTDLLLPGSTTVVYFEDGDVASGSIDYTDIVFSVSNTVAAAPGILPPILPPPVVPVPEPATLLLVSMGFGAIFLKKKLIA